MKCTTYHIKSIAQITKMGILLVKIEKGTLFSRKAWFILLSNVLIVAGGYLSPFFYSSWLQTCTNTCSQLLNHGILTNYMEQDHKELTLI